MAVSKKELGGAQEALVTSLTLLGVSLLDAIKITREIPQKDFETFVRFKEEKRQIVVRSLMNHILNEIKLHKVKKFQAAHPHSSDSQVRFILMQEVIKEISTRFSAYVEFQRHPLKSRITPAMIRRDDAHREKKETTRWERIAPEKLFVPPAVHPGMVGHQRTVIRRKPKP